MLKLIKYEFRKNRTGLLIMLLIAAGLFLLAPLGAALEKEGRLPWRASPSSVNWLTSSTLPPTSFRDRFIFSFSSSKTRSPQIFFTQ